MTDTPQVLLAHHLKIRLKLTIQLFLRQRQSWPADALTEILRADACAVCLARPS